jgi:putative thiamine transport system substrate-binding protein
MNRRELLAFAALSGLGWTSGAARAEEFAAIAEKARGQTVFFNAWGGDPKINAFIAWAGETLRARAGVDLRQVKLADTADAVTRIIAEAEAGRTDGGSVDLIWINGRNFATLKGRGLLHGPFVDRLPNHALVDLAGNPTALVDATVPVEGFQAAWGTARFVFVADSALDPEPPRTPEAILAFARANPGRFSYPQPPDFIGVTFLKQVLHALAPDRAALARPVAEAAFAAAAAPLFAYLDALHPHLWREGRAFPANGTALRTMMANAELRLIMTFNPAMAANAVMSGELPDTVRTYAMEGGSIGNTHFLAIPKNANALAGALVAADFLLSPEAQGRKADVAVWGDPTVLALDRLSAEDRALFAQEGHPSYPDPASLGPIVGEPHPDWAGLLEAAWKARYAGG